MQSFLDSLKKPIIFAFYSLLFTGLMGSYCVGVINFKKDWPKSYSYFDPITSASFLLCCCSYLLIIAAVWRLIRTIEGRDRYSDHQGASHGSRLVLLNHLRSLFRLKVILFCPFFCLVVARFFAESIKFESYVKWDFRLSFFYPMSAILVWIVSVELVTWIAVWFSYKIRYLTLLLTLSVIGMLSWSLFPFYTFVKFFYREVTPIAKAVLHTSPAYLPACLECAGLGEFHTFRKDWRYEMTLIWPTVIHCLVYGGAVIALRYYCLKRAVFILREDQKF